MTNPHIDRLREALTHDPPYAESDDPSALVALDALAAELDAAKRENERLAQEMEHPFDKSEFDAMFARAERAEAALAEAQRDWQQYVHEVKDEQARADAAERALDAARKALRESQEREIRYPYAQAVGKNAVVVLTADQIDLILHAFRDISVLETLACSVTGEMRRARAALAAEPADTQPEGRDPVCVEAWPECRDGLYDPRCCRFPKSCSAGPRPAAAEEE